MTTSQCTFIRLLSNEAKGAALSDSIKNLEKGETSSALYPVAPEKFSLIPGSPFAYWVSDRIRQLFVDLPSFEGNGRTVKQGLATADDFRFVRAWWEVYPDQIVTGTSEMAPEEFRAKTFAGRKWVPFAKGGEYSPYYADMHLVVNWEKNGEDVKEWICERYPYVDGNWGWVVKNTEYYFKPGLTWPRRSFTLRAAPIPKGCIFSHAGMMAFPLDNELNEMLGIFNSLAFDYFSRTKTSSGSGSSQFEVGIMQTNPLPKENFHNIQLENQVVENSQISQYLESNTEINTNFCVPLKKMYQFLSISEGVEEYSREISVFFDKYINLQKSVDQICYSLYDFSEEDIQQLLSMQIRPSGKEGLFTSDIREIYLSKFQNLETPRNIDYYIRSILSYILGTIFGRWDIRYAIGEKEPPELPDPFAPLPACSPGMLQGEDGLPLDPHEIPRDYPLAVDADGILVDDEGHSDDIIARIRDVLTIIWGDRADAIEKEACEILGMKSLRDYFRKPTAGGFWDDHVKRYSKSRRKAPIYWLLQSAKKNYAIWIYYPRMDGDTLYKALRYAKDKLAMEERRLEDMKGELSQLGTGGVAVKRLEKEIDGQEAFISELHDFVEKLERAANLDLIPEHDDGVVLTIAPLHELVPWKEPKKYWDELIDGKYEWSSIGKQMREKGLVKRN